MSAKLEDDAEVTAKLMLVLMTGLAEANEDVDAITTFSV